MLKFIEEAELTAQNKSLRDICSEEHFQEQVPQFPRFPVRIQRRDVSETLGGWSLSMQRRCFDFIVSLLVLIVAFIPGLLVYVLIRATSKGP